MASYKGTKHSGEYTHKTVTCKKCGNPNCVWVQNKQGRWYLVEHSGVGAPNLGFYYLKHNIHKCEV